MEKGPEPKGGLPLADGRNKFIQYQPLVTGTYRVCVTGEGTTAGEYFLSVAGDTGALPSFYVTDTIPPDGFHGEIKLDQFLSQNVGGQNQGTFPTLAVTVPEPGTLALGSLAVAGLAAWRGRRTAPAAAI